MAIDTKIQRSRRALLFGAAGGLAALAAQALGRPPAVQATHGDVHLGAFNGATSTTVIGNSTENGGAIMGNASGSQSGVHGNSPTGYGISGYSDSGTGVYGVSYGQYGVHALNNSAGGGTAILGQSANTGTGVHGDSPSGYGVYGTSTSSYAVVGLSSASAGVAGFSDAGNGVIGSTSSAIGVLGQGGTGRGARFSGKKAQIRLDPSTAATHPTSGVAGDIFLDGAKRLWLCKGRTSWVRLDT